MPSYVAFIRRLVTRCCCEKIPQLSGHPFVFINTLPKSGSMFIWEGLLQGLNLQQCRISSSSFPDDVVSTEALSTFCTGGYCSQEHVPATEFNVRALCGFLDRFVIHIRDPRQAMLSWIHHIDVAYEKNIRAQIVGFCPPIPDGYLGWDLPQKIDFHLDHHYRFCVNWITGWMSAIDGGELGADVLVTEFSAMKDNPRGLFEEILAFYGIPSDDFCFPEQPKKRHDRHYRKGEKNEWKRVFSKQQQAVASALLPDSLCDRFGWLH